ncbi:hypothetical protein ACOME3_007238 [Neoechinorhynchus agilis]
MYMAPIVNLKTSLESGRKYVLNERTLFQCDVEKHKICWIPSFSQTRKNATKEGESSKLSPADKSARPFPFFHLGTTMKVSDVEALQAWLLEVLPPMCSADPNILSRYILALVQKDKPESDLRQICVSQLRIFLMDETDRFLDLLFDCMRTESYLATSKEQPLNEETSRHLKSQAEDPRRARRRSSSSSSPMPPRHRRRSEEGDDQRRKRARDFRRRSPPVHRNRTEFRQRPNDANVDRPQPIQSVVQAVPHRRRRRYSPPQHGPPAADRQSRNVVPVLRTLWDESSALIEEPKNEPTQTNSSEPHYQPQIQESKRRKSDQMKSSTIEVRRIPVSQNNVTDLGQHFSRFGRITNIQISHENQPDTALITFSASHEAERAFRSPDPVLNNRFIRLSRYFSEPLPVMPNMESVGVQRQPSTRIFNQRPQSMRPFRTMSHFVPFAPQRFPRRLRPPSNLPNRFANPQLFNKKNEVYENKNGNKNRPRYEELKEDYNILDALVAEQKKMFDTYEQIQNDQDKAKLSAALSDLLELIERQNRFVKEKVKALEEKNEIDEVVNEATVDDQQGQCQK